MSTTITQEQVSSIAEELQSEGINPTVLDIRKRLEGSSMAVVWTYFQLWQQSKKSEKQDDAMITLPDELQQMLQDFIQKQVTTSKALIEDELNALREANDTLAKEVDELKDLHQRQADELKAARSAREEVSGRFEQLNSELIRAKNEIDIEKQSATEARKELVKAQLKLESSSRLEADLDQVYKTLEDERVARVNAEHQVSALELKLEAETAARKKAEQELLDFHRNNPA